MHEAERGLFDLQRGRPLSVTTPADHLPARSVLLATVEGLTPRTLDQLQQLGPDRLRLAVTGHRARAMGLSTNGPGPGALSLRIGSRTTPREILSLASATVPSGRWRQDASPASDTEKGGLTLARLGRLLPAVVSVAIDHSTADTVRTLVADGAVLEVTTEQIETMALDDRVEVSHVSDGPVPLAEAEDARFMSFREANGILEHVAVLIGDREDWPDPVPVRIHFGMPDGRSVREPSLRLWRAAPREPARLSRGRRWRSAVPRAGGAWYRVWKTS